MKHIKLFNESILDRYSSHKMTDDIIEYTLDRKISNSEIDIIKKEHPDKWVLTYFNGDSNYIFIKEKPKKYNGYIPKILYHYTSESNIDNIIKNGLKTSSKLDSPFGYEDLTFLFTDIEDCKYQSGPDDIILSIDTVNLDIDYFEDPNKEMDDWGEIITTNCTIPSKKIKKI